MDNSTNGCYFISLIQALHNTASLRDLFIDPSNFLFRETSNTITMFNDQRDPRLPQHRYAIECLTDLFFRLDSRGPALEVAATENILRMLRRLWVQRGKAASAARASGSRVAFMRTCW